MSDLVLQRQQRQTHYYVEFLDEELGIDMVQIPGGTFWMGAPDNEPGHRRHETPQHPVTVPDFFMGRYPITQAQWRFVAGLPQISIPLNPEPSHFKGDRRPVECINWDESVEFCQRLTRHRRRPYRLPSEAEWEYACRAGTTTPFYFGSSLTLEVAHYADQAQAAKGVCQNETLAVDALDFANGFGLCHMHGNVWEWCQDVWHSSYEDAPQDGTAWLTDGTQNRRVLRGGSWYLREPSCRSAFRYYGVPGVRNNDIGFRIASSC